MSDGDEEPTDADEAAGEENAPALDADAIEERLDEAEAALEDAETEAALDEVEDTLDEIEGAIEAASLPEPEDEDEEPVADRLETRLSDLRDELEGKRGPYAEDVVETVESAASTITDTRWTEAGEADLVDVIGAFADSVNETLGTDVRPAGEDLDALAETLSDLAAAVGDADLDPDEDADTIAALVEAADDLEAGLDDAQAWDDLSVRQKLQAEGFYDVLGQKHKDFPPEWSALKEWEKRDDAEKVLLLLDRMGDSGFIEAHCLDTLERMGNPAAFDEMMARAEKRGKPAIAVLGKIADEAALETIQEYVDADSDPVLQRVTLRAVGEIGSEESTQAVANKLVADNQTTRSRAARALGMLGDARAIDPLADVLGDADEAAPVRASAAWALVQIGTQRALEAAAAYADADSYIVQVEAEVADEALKAEAPV